MRKMKLWILGATLVAAAGLLSLRTARSAQDDDMYSQIRLLVEVMRNIQNQYVEETNLKSLVYGAATGMIRKLDPFSQFMEPDAHKEMKVETEGHFGGLGIRIAIRDGWLTVITPLPNTPAYRLGILPGDKIIKIEGKSTQGIDLYGAVKKLRGPPKTKVNITISREGEKEAIDYTVTREEIKIRSVQSRMLTDEIAYIRLIEFIEPTYRDMNRALKKFKAKGMKSLVLDLRNNPGGLLNSAVDVTKTFLGENSLIVYTEGRVQPRQEYRAEEKSLYSNLPIIVLVNKGSASGSEIVAGALQDHKRALILGGNTFGKASVQSVIGLSDGSALRLTTAKYYTPNGRAIHRNKETGKGGIDPDITIEVPREIVIKLQQQSDEVYAKGKKPKSNIESDKFVRDEVLERAKELLQARVLFQSLKE